MFEFVLLNSMPLCKEALVGFFTLSWAHALYGQTKVLHHASLNSDIFSQESHKIKHLNMQSPFIIIFERTGYFKELTQFECGIVKGSHHWFSSNFPDIPQSAIHGILATWKHLGTTVTGNFRQYNVTKKVHQCT